MAQSEPQVYLFSNPRFLPQLAAFAEHGFMAEFARYEHDGIRLARLMARAGVNNTQLAEAVDKSEVAVGKWIKSGKIARENVVKICQALSCSSDELLGMTDIQTVASVAEARAMYGFQRQDVQRMILKYLSASPSGQATLQEVGTAVAKSSSANSLAAPPDDESEAG